MKQPIPILALAATAAAFSTGCLSVTGFDAPCPARAVEDSLRISVAAQAAGQDAETLAQDVKTAASQNIARRGFRLVEGGNPDVTISFDASQKEFNRAGDFIVYDGRVDARIMAPWGENLVIDARTFAVRGERALGETAAKARLSAAITPQVDAWLSTAVTAEKLAVSAVTVMVEYRHVKASRKAALVDDFIRATMDTEGVRDCQLVAETWEPGFWGATYGASYRIVFDAAAFPNGPLNTIALRNPGLELSVLPAALPAR